MNNIIQVANKRDEIAAGAPVTCQCGEKWFSVFDKLYVSAYGKCTSCSTIEELEARSDNIFALI